ncbi:MAG: HXXEE domain-containing protein [Solirubrobacteraceae bacterium]
MSLETHGRWPLAGALGLIPISVAALKRPVLRPLAALLWHQTEEWVWPGSFLPWINREVLGSDVDEFPIDRRIGLILNVMFGWGFSLTPLAGARATAPAALLYTTHLGNSALHVSWAVRHRRYDPGTITSVTTLAPVAIIGLRALTNDPQVSRRALRAGVLGGLVMSATLVPALKWRIRRRHSHPSATPSA